MALHDLLLSLLLSLDGRVKLFDVKLHENTDAFINKVTAS